MYLSIGLVQQQTPKGHLIICSCTFYHSRGHFIVFNLPLRNQKEHFCSYLYLILVKVAHPDIAVVT